MSTFPNRPSRSNSYLSYNKTNNLDASYFLKQLVGQGFEVKNKLEEGTPWLFEPDLFYKESYLYNRYEHKLKSYYLLSALGVAAVMHWKISEDNKAVSILHAPYGGMQAYSELPIYLRQMFSCLIVEDLQKLGITEYEIALPALGINEKIKEQLEIWNDLGFTNKKQEINHHLLIDNINLEKKLHNSALRRLRKSLNAGFVFQQDTEANLKEIYDFIIDCRREKNYYFSLTYDQVKRLIDTFPENYLLFTVRLNNTIAAATIAVKTNNNVLYNFAPAHHTVYDNYSPVVLLTSGLYQWCENHSISVLDLGTSMLNDKINEPLVTFKKRLGGIESYKYTLQKTVNG